MPSIIPPTTPEPERAPTARTLLDNWAAGAANESATHDPKPMSLERERELRRELVRETVGTGPGWDAAHARTQMLAEALAEVTRLRSEAAASRAAALDEAADAVARRTLLSDDCSCVNELRSMAAAARDAQTGGAR